MDPGVITGIAVYGEDGELESSMAVNYKTFYKNGFFTSLVSMTHPDVVLVEDIPQNNVHRETLELYTYIMHWFKIAGFKTASIKPSQWKGLVERVEIPGQHARDAATMAKWWLKNNA